MKGHNKRTAKGVLKFSAKGALEDHLRYILRKDRDCLPKKPKAQSTDEKDGSEEEIAEVEYGM